MTKFPHTSCLTLMLALTSVFGARLQDHLTQDEVKEIELFAADMTACARLSGLTVGVVKGDTTFSTGLGVAVWDTGYPVLGSTNFNLGSTSKAFVPYVLAELMNSESNNDGKLQWDKTLRELLYSQLGLEVSAPWADVRLKDALVYRASNSPLDGAAADPDVVSSNTAADMSTTTGLPEGVTREEIVRRAAQFLPDSPEFQASGHYSNMMYTVASLLAESVSGMSWEQLVEKYVFDRHDMNVSHFAPQGLMRDNAALPYRFSMDEDYLQQNNSIFDIHPFEPVGSIMASASDVTKWMRHLLHNLHDKGSDSGKNMLIGDAFVRAITPPVDHGKQNTGRASLRHDSDKTMGYGMGWQVSEYRGRKQFKYSGRLYAFTSQMWLYPDNRTAVFVATNGHAPVSDPDAGGLPMILDSLLYYISDVVHREPRWLDYLEVCKGAGYQDFEDLYDLEVELPNMDDQSQNDESDVKPVRVPQVNYPSSWEAYQGSYANGLIGDLYVTLNDVGVLEIKLGRNLEGELWPEDDTSTKLRLKVTGFLANTDEWADDKVIEFLDLSEGLARFQTARLFWTDKLFYDFHRGRAFQRMLVEAEEANVDRARAEEARIMREEQERRMKKEAELRAKAEVERKAREEAQRRKEEAQRKRQEEEAERKRQEEEEAARWKAQEERRIREEAAKRMQEEEKRREREEAARRAREEEGTTEPPSVAVEVRTDRVYVGEINTAVEEDNYSNSRTTAPTSQNDAGDDITHNSVNSNGHDNNEPDSNNHMRETISPNTNGNSESSRQSHQPYFVDENNREETETSLEELPPHKSAKPAGHSTRTGEHRSGAGGDTDGAMAGPATATGLVIVAAFLALLHTLVKQD